MKKLLTIEVTEVDGQAELNCSPLPTAEQLDELLQALGEMRAQMQPPVQVAVPTGGAGIPIAPAPGWFVGNYFPQGKVFGLRHPSFGWLAFQATDGLVDALKAALDALPPEPQSQH